MDWTAISVLFCAIGQCLALFAGDIFQNVHKLRKQEVYPEIPSNTHFNTFSSTLRPDSSPHEHSLRKRFIFNKLQNVKEGYQRVLKDSDKHVFIYPALLTVTHNLLNTIHGILRNREWVKDGTSSINEALDSVDLDSDPKQSQEDEGNEYYDVGSVGDSNHASDTVHNPTQYPWITRMSNREKGLPSNQPTDDDFLYVSKYADSAFEKNIADLLDTHSVVDEDRNLPVDDISSNRNPPVRHGTQTNFDGFYPGLFDHPNFGTNSNIDSLKSFGEQLQQPQSDTPGDPFEPSVNQPPSSEALGDHSLLQNLIMPRATPQKYDTFFQTDDVHAPPTMFDPKSIQFDGLPDFPSFQNDENPEYFGQSQTQQFPGFVNFDLLPQYPNENSYSHQEDLTDKISPEENMIEALEHANQFGMPSEGVFLDPMTLCQDIEGQQCSSDTECSCYGMLSCIHGQCGMKPAMFGAPPKQDDTEDDGMWLSEPVEKEGIVY